MTKDLNCDDTKITAVLKLPDARPRPPAQSSPGCLPIRKNAILLTKARPRSPSTRPPTRKNPIPLTKKPHHPRASEGPDTEKHDLADQKPHHPTRSEGPTRKNAFLLTKKRPMTKTHQPPFEAAPPTRKNPVVLTKPATPRPAQLPRPIHRLKFAILPGVSGGKIQGVGQLLDG